MYPLHLVFARLSVAFGMVCLAGGASASPTLIDLSASAARADADSHVTSVYRHARPTSNGGAQREQLEFRGVAPAGPGAGLGAASNLFGNRYPADLTYHGGAVVTSLVNHAIFINSSKACPAPACWGDPLTFLSDLGKSNFVHIIDQFVGATAPNRYTVADKNFKVNLGTLTAPLTDVDIEAIVAKAVAATGQSGYTHQYHVFLAPGVDECFDSSFTVCYSPDNFASWYFCAYHGSFDVTGVGHVLYSVEPYQNVSGCSDTGATPNGALTDSTDSVLSHEVFETITDPDGDAWWNSADNGLYGQEIGDECSFVNATGFDPSLYRVNGKLYAAQPEYSNLTHACSTNGGD